MSQQTRDTFVIKATRRCFAGTTALLLATVVLVAIPDLQPAYCQEPASTPPAGESQPAGVDPAAPADAPAKRVVDYNNPTLDDILDAWQEREEKVKSCKFVWSVTTTMHYHFDKSSPNGLERIRNNAPVVRHQTDATFALQGVGMALGSPMLQPNLDAKSSSNTWYRSNGTEFGELIGRNDSKSHLAYITNRRQMPDLDQFALTPFLSLYRPLYPVSMSYTTVDQASTLPREIAISVLPADLKQPEFVEVQFEKPTYRTVYTLKRVPGFPVQNVTVFSDDGSFIDPYPLVMRMQIEPHDVAGWIPRSWEYSRNERENGLIEFVREGAVTSVSINEPIEESMFDPFNVPVGTRIEDQRSPSEVKRYVIGEDGRTEPAVDIDLTQPSQRPRWDIGSVMIGVNAVLFVALFIVWVIRRRAR